jgi:hypothetical protein
LISTLNSSVGRGVDTFANYPRFKPGLRNFFILITQILI